MPIRILLNMKRVCSTSEKKIVHGNLDHEMYNLLHILCMEEDIDQMSTILLETPLIVADNTRHCLMTHISWNVSNGSVNIYS